MTFSDFIEKIKEQKTRKLSEDPDRKEATVCCLAKLLSSILFDGLTKKEINEVVAIAKGRIKTKNPIEIEVDYKKAIQKLNKKFFK